MARNREHPSIITAHSSTTETVFNAFCSRNEPFPVPLAALSAPLISPSNPIYFFLHPEIHLQFPSLASQESLHPPGETILPISPGTTSTSHVQLLAPFLRLSLTLLLMDTQMWKCPWPPSPILVLCSRDHPGSGFQPQLPLMVTTERGQKEISREAYLCNTGV
jgi:hypothetical protein